MIKQNNVSVIKKVLKNGLTVLVRPVSNIPKVSVQLWYNVGSKDEKSGEKGIAHLIEHMIFKGTNKLSESDINLITHKLSGYCNAFTSYDYTGYLFDLPSQHWQESLPIMADCMQNCTFKQELLNSELKAVIQELKMYKDHFVSSIVENLITAMFPGHPYQHPIIGYKHDLWNLDRNNLLNFYKRHYAPNNATLVIVGDVNPDEVFELAEKNFGSISANLEYKKEEFNIPKDLVSRNVTIYRDIKQPIVVLAFPISGACAKLDYPVDVLSWIVGTGRGSRLYKKLVDELELVTDVDVYSYDLFDEGTFFIQFEPKDQEKIDYIIELIKKELIDLAKNGPSKKELNRAAKKVSADYLTLLESNQKQAYAIGKFYLSTGDENYAYNYLEDDEEKLDKTIRDLIKNYLRPSIMSIGKVLPIPEEEKPQWDILQQKSDEEDARILSGKSRELPVEEGVMVNTIEIKEPSKFNYPKYQSFILDNGLEVLFYNNPSLPKIDVVLELKAKNHYDPENIQGLSNFVSNMLLEGTEQYNYSELTELIESNGMTLSSYPGFLTISSLSSDFKKALDILTQIVSKSTFESSSINKIKEQILFDIKNFWDSPSQFISQLAKENIYKNHPYKKNILGDESSISKINRDELIGFYKDYISPKGARIAIVGNLAGQNLEQILKETLGAWEGPEVQELEYPILSGIASQDINYQINRDQVVLAFAGKSISRNHPDFDKILLFDQIFCGGVLGSMSSRLFQLREQSGLFYTIGGSLLFRSDDQPGMTFVKTIVSLDRLDEAENLIKKSMDSATQLVTDDEFLQARNALINSLVDNFESNKQIAHSFLFLRRHNLASNFFDIRPQQLMQVTKQDMQDAASKVLDSNQMIKLRAGRIN